MGDVIKLRAARKQAERLRDEKRAAANRAILSYDEGTDGRSPAVGARRSAKPHAGEWSAP